MARKPSADVNLALIASKMGLSVSTVSRALRGAEGIHQGTRSKVIEMAEAMGYTGSHKKNADAAAKPYHIMALVQRSMPFSDQKYLSGMSRASVTLNLAILSHHVPAQECQSLLDPKLQPTSMRAGLVDGLVFVHRWPLDVAAELSRQWPSVSIVHEYPGTLIDQIGIDDRGGVSTLVRHLQAGGHKRIGYFGFCPEMSWSTSRMGAFVEALSVLRLPFDPRDIVEISLEEALSPTSMPSGSWNATVNARMKQGVDAWLCASSATGYSLCRYLLDRGLRMPEDVAVASCHGGSSLSPGDLPAITSTEVTDEELGAAALRRLIHRFEHPNESRRSILFTSDFVQGQTTRPVTF